MKKNISILFLLLLILFLSCKENVTLDEPNLDVPANEVIISLEEYNTAPREPVALEDYSIEEDILKITYSASGCSGGSWVVKLIDSGLLLESYPPQRNLVFSLKNEEICEAYITKEILFDISKLKIEGDSIYLNLINLDTSILYY
ncbi:hypothetical protein [Flammeovirga kamogawensis]|uniref:Uncharacterized protein n=1 Tax=Flammeovirga kamogawensis TaxID=373891 RepID=A0ABX8H350_9BACT|nr:hypothetical protein [Flammeovirga kamogawensis]MBB6460440.1 hypothetical protein [Flammeovirga kamogawensis]QWG10245.1 hypothetical protein KM029_21420 [Flammeovirga kamogawensis]TRX64694.1 hypothetical protein EO216_19345 [Flammeovirga kamogawensis]